jgi:hypothetical protein
MPRKKKETNEVPGMKFTLAILEQAEACSGARRAFVEKFGSEGEVSARDAFVALAEANQRDWLYWLIDHFPGFLKEVGDVDAGNWKNRVSQTVEVEVIEVHDGLVFSSGSSTVEAYGSSTVEAYDSSTVRAYDSSTVEAYGSSTVRAYGSSTVEAYGSSTVRAYDSSTVRAYDSSTVRAYGSSTVEAYDSSTVRAYDSSTVMVSEYYSERVEVEILTPMAAAVDRRSGEPVLILADGKEAEEVK